MSPLATRRPIPDMGIDTGFGQATGLGRVETTLPLIIRFSAVYRIPKQTNVLLSIIRPTRKLPSKAMRHFTERLRVGPNLVEIKKPDHIVTLLQERRVYRTFLPGAWPQAS